MNQPIYLDHAATTPADPTVVASMLPYLTDNFYNPSATYTAARDVKRDLEAARAQIAHHLGARPSELIFTAGGTEANNLAIRGIMQAFPDGELIISSVEHDSVMAPAGSFSATFAPVLPDGRVDVEALGLLISDQTVLMSVQYVNNEVGTIQPLKEIAALIATVKKARQKADNQLPLYFHTDACQASAYLDIHTSRVGVDMMTINASKIYGPKQIGALFVKAGTVLAPQILGGGQERGMRSGTENVAAVIGFAKALDLVQARRHDESKRLAELQRYFIRELKAKLPAAEVNGSLKHRIANNVHVTFPGTDNETLMMQLDNRGIICAVGSACSASNDEPSHVLKAMGLSETDSQSSLRFTMGISTTEADIAQLVDCLVELIG